MARFLSLMIGGYLVASAGLASAAPLNTLSDEERAAGWILLFDGLTTNGWRNYRHEDISAGWQAVDGALTRVGEAGDIVTVAQYRDFELTLDWRVAEGGNSGVFFRADEDHATIFMSAPEVQFLDDAGHFDGRSELTSAGSNYGLHPAPRGIVKAAGEWNSVRLLVSGNRVTQWLNGVEIVSYELGSADWRARVKTSKFNAWPDYGLNPQGFIGLQDHGDSVAFRNVKLRKINAQ